LSCKIAAYGEGLLVAGPQEGTQYLERMELTDKNKSMFDQTDCMLTPGEPVQQSGIYEICHHDEERSSVILMRNTIFPFCRQCGELVRYKVLELVPHISEDPDFQEDALKPDNPRFEVHIPRGMAPTQLSRAHGYRFHQDTLQAGPGGPQGGDL
jgi:hypothetical protein